MLKFGVVDEQVVSIVSGLSRAGSERVTICHINQLMSVWNKAIITLAPRCLPVPTGQQVCNLVPASNTATGVPMVTQPYTGRQRNSYRWANNKVGSNCEPIARTDLRRGHRRHRLQMRSLSSSLSYSTEGKAMSPILMSPLCPSSSSSPKNATPRKRYRR